MEWHRVAVGVVVVVGGRRRVFFNEVRNKKLVNPHFQLCSLLC